MFKRLIVTATAILAVLLVSSAEAIGVPGAQSAIFGSVWRDTNHDRSITSGEPMVPGMVVELLSASGTLLQQTTTDASGNYGFLKVASSKTEGFYQIRFRDSGSNGIVLGTPTNDDAALNQAIGSQVIFQNRSSSEIADATTLRVWAIGDVIIKQSLPLDPSGVVYDAAQRTPIAGATVQLASVPAGFDPATHLVGGVANSIQTTGALGIYEFLLTASAPVGQYCLAATAASYISPSVMIPPTSASFTPPNGIGVVSVNAANLSGFPPPQVGQDTTYYSCFNFTPGVSQGVVNNHLPLDPAVAPQVLIVSKTGNKSMAEIGDVVTYTIQARLNTGSKPNVELVDSLPAGFRYIPGTATLATGTATAVALADPLPAGNLGPQLIFKVGTVLSTAPITLSYKVRIGVGAMQGDGINRVYGRASGGFTSNTAQFRVKVSGGVFTTDACVVGKVFVDCNGNHIQDTEEVGIPGVRLYMEDGTYFITDVEGKYSYCGISPRTHVLKADNATLPRGSRLTTTSNRNAGDANSLFLDVKNGELIRGDFAEGSCSNTVLEQVKARRSQGEVRAPETERKHGPALKFEGKSADYPQQGTDSANQAIVKPRAPQGVDGAHAVTETVNDQPVGTLPDASANTRGNNLRDVKGGVNAH